MFDDIYKKLELELKNKKEMMQKVIQEAEKAYEQRARAKKELNVLKQDAEKEQEEF